MFVVRSPRRLPGIHSGTAQGRLPCQDTHGITSSTRRRAVTADPAMIPRTIRPAHGRQTILVPMDRIGDAQGLGAIYDRSLRTWTVSDADAGRIPRNMLPTRDRPGLDPPYLKISLLPQTSWGRNVRSMMGLEQWSAFAKAHAYASTGSVCRICGGRGEKWPVEADEVWRYDDARSLQTLHAIIPLCPACHEVRSAGLATKNGRRRAIVLHLA